MAGAGASQRPTSATRAGLRVAGSATTCSVEPAMLGGVSLSTVGGLSLLWAGRPNAGRSELAASAPPARRCHLRNRGAVILGSDDADDLIEPDVER